MDKTDRKTIKDPAIGTIVKQHGWLLKDYDNYPCDVLITGGSYYSNGRISNFWYWRRVLPDLTLSAEEDAGYGAFEESENTYQVEQVYKITKTKEA